MRRGWMAEIGVWAMLASGCGLEVSQAVGDGVPASEAPLVEVRVAPQAVALVEPAPAPVVEPAPVVDPPPAPPPPPRPAAPARPPRPKDPYLALRYDLETERLGL